MTLMWILTSLLLAAGFSLVASATPRLIERRRIRRQLHRLGKHPGAAEASSEADLLRPVEMARGWAAWLRRFPRLNSERLMRSAGVSWSVERYFLVRIVWAVPSGVVIYAITQNAWWTALSIAAGFMAPTYYLKRRRAKRLAAFELQLPDAIELISRSLRAGHPLVHGLKLAGEDTPEPLAAEFRTAHEEHRFGMPLDETLVRLGERLELSDARILVTAILVQRDAGGNIAEVFERLAQLMRERVVLSRQVRVHTAQGRMSGYVLSSLPVAVAGLLLLINPEYIRLLFDDPIGRVMLGCAAVMQIIGHLWIQKIVRVEV